MKREGFSGENIDYGEKDPIDVIISLAVDDGVPLRGHLHNIFSKGFKKMACYTGYHKMYTKQTAINYNGSDAEMNAFMKEPVDFGEALAGSIIGQTSTKMHWEGKTMVKTSTRIYTLQDGS